MQRADKRRYHYIYKITRDDGRYYIGLHSTDDLDDGYFGSGKRITRSIKKHGLDRHKKEILEFHTSRKEVKDREKEIITEDLRADPMCMNIAPGGGGGFINEEHARKCGSAGGKIGGRKFAQSVTFEELSRRAKLSIVIGRSTATFSDKEHRIQTREKISRSMIGKQTGEKNSQFGTKWMNDGQSSIKVRVEQVETFLSNGFCLGRIKKR